MRNVFELLKMSNCHFDECKVGIQQINMVHGELALQMIALPQHCYGKKNVNFNYHFTLKNIVLHMTH